MQASRSVRRTWSASMSIAVVAAAAAVGAGCRRAQPADDAAAPVVVTTVTAKPDTFREVVKAAGTIVPSALGDLTVYAPGPATIADLPKKENDAVVAGDVLVRFDIPSISETLAAQQLAALKATDAFNRAKSTADRQTALFAQGLIPRITLDASKATLASAQAALDNANANLQAATLAADSATIKAKFSGTVIKVWHAVGDSVSGTSDDPILRVVDATHVQAAADVPAAQAARIVTGQPATVQSVDGTITAAGSIVAGAAARQGAPTREIRVAFTTPAPMPLDTPVTVSVLIGAYANAIMVPAAAVQQDATGGTYVMVAGDDGRAHRHDVRIGVTADDLAQLLTGVAPGDQIITDGVADVSEGTPLASR